MRFLINKIKIIKELSKRMNREDNNEPVHTQRDEEDDASRLVQKDVGDQYYQTKQQDKQNEKRNEGETTQELYFTMVIRRLRSWTTFFIFYLRHKFCTTTIKKISIPTLQAC